jgi:type IV secretion system protein TrbL
MSFTILMPRTSALLGRLMSVGFIGLVLLVALAFTPTHAIAQSFDLSGITSIESQANGWFATAQGWAQHTYLLLFVIELTIIGVQGVLFRENLAEFIATFAFKVFVAGFFLWLIANADTFFHGVVNGFKSAGQQLGTGDSGMATVMAGGLACAAMLIGAANAGQGVDKGLSFIPNLYLGTGPTGAGNSASAGHQLFSFMMTAIGLMVIFAVGGIIIQYAMITIESYIVLGAGVLFLGFAGTRFTLPFAQGYMQYAVNVGVKLFTFYLLLGAVQGLLPNALASAGLTLAAAMIPYGIGSDLAVLPAGIAAFTLVLITTLLYAVPNFAGSFLSGSSSLSSGQFMGQLTGAMASTGQLMMGAQMMKTQESHQKELHELNHSTSSSSSTSSNGLGAMPASHGVEDANETTHTVFNPRVKSGEPPAAFSDGSGNGYGVAGGSGSSSMTRGQEASINASPSYIQPAVITGPNGVPLTTSTTGAAAALRGGGGEAAVPFPSGQRFGPGVPVDAQFIRSASVTPPESLSADAHASMTEEQRAVFADVERREMRADQAGLAGMYMGGGLRGLGPQQEAPVQGVQIRLNNADKL